MLRPRLRWSQSVLQKRKMELDDCQCVMDRVLLISYLTGTSRRQWPACLPSEGPDRRHSGPSRCWDFCWLRPLDWPRDHGRCLQFQIHDTGSTESLAPLVTVVGAGLVGKYATPESLVKVGQLRAASPAHGMTDEKEDWPWLSTVGALTIL